MMPEWHQLVCMSGHVKESETAKILQLYGTSIFQVHSFVCQLDYNKFSLAKYQEHNPSSVARPNLSGGAK